MALQTGAGGAQGEALLACILDMGELLLVSGAEVRRVEDTLTRLCAAYGFERADVFNHYLQHCAYCGGPRRPGAHPDPPHP